MGLLLTLISCLTPAVHLQEQRRGRTRVGGPDYGQGCPGSLVLVGPRLWLRTGVLKMQVQVWEGLRPCPCRQGPCVGTSGVLTQRSRVAAFQHPPLLLGVPQGLAGESRLC